MNEIEQKESGTFDEQTIMSRTGHRSTAVLQLQESKEHSGESCLKRLSITNQGPRMKNFKSRRNKLTSSESSATTSLVIKHGETTLSFNFS